MANPDKDTIYIDIDEEITGVIDKLNASKSKVVALVLPKRAAVFQSIVNMKLLKRAADSSKKNLVLITSEAGLLPLAGAAGIHVAKSLTSRPEIPSAPQTFQDSDEAIDEDEAVVSEEPDKLDPNKTLGQLAGDEAVVSDAKPDKDGVETLTLDNEELPPETKDEAKPAADKKDVAKNKKLKIPNFERFRLILGIGLLLLILIIAGFIFANASLAKATINISTNASNIPTSLTLNLSTAASAIEPSNNTIPAKQEQQQKTFSQQVPTTGQKNNGNKASGSVTMTAKECALVGAADVPSGTGLSSNGLTYITQSDTSFQPANVKNGCIYFTASSNTTIIAQSGGTNYNNATTFSVAGRSDVSVTVASAISGGTDDIVQTVNQNDINSAKSKISSNNDSSIKQALQSQLNGESYYPIVTTYNVGTPTTTSSANVGDIASSVTVTQTIAYSMFGVHKSDLKSLIDNSVNGQIDTAKQSILDEGIDTASFTVGSLSSTGGTVNLSAKAVAGPHLNISTIKSNAAGKRVGDIKSQLLIDPGVTNVSINLSPFWATTAPKNTSKINVKIAKPTTTKAGP